MTVQIQNSKGKPSNVSSDTTINLSSSSPNGRFDTSQSGLFNGSVTSVTIPKGSAAASFYYRDGNAGSPTITATETPGQGWNQGTQQQKVNPPLTITTASLRDGDAGTSYSQILGSSGGTGTYTWSVSTGALPTGLTLGGNTISGMPTAASMSNVTVEVSDGIGKVAKAFTIKINSLLAVSTASLPSADPTISYSQTLGASGGSGAYTWSITGGNLPAGLSLEAATGVISGTPTSSGTSTFTVNVNDSIGLAGKPMTVTVNAPLTIVTSLLPNGTQNAAYSQTLAAAGGSGLYTWSITGGALPTGLSLSGSTISGTATDRGEFNFTIQANDGIGSVARGVSITILGTGQVTPILSASPTTLSFGSSTSQKSFNITNTGGGALNWHLSADQPWVSFSSSSGSGNATITVTVDRNNLNSGTYTANVSISSNGGNQTIALTVQVQK